MPSSEGVPPDLVVCATAPDQKSGQTLCEHLERAGIKPVLSAITPSPKAPPFSKESGGFEILVDPQFKEQAQSVLDGEYGDPSRPSEDVSGADRDARRAQWGSFIGFLVFQPILLPFSAALTFRASRQWEQLGRVGRRRTIVAILVNLATLVCAYFVFSVVFQLLNVRPELEAANILEFQPSEEKPEEVRVEPKVMRELLTEKCEKGEGEACFELGLMWGNGMGGPKSQQEARQWVEKGCQAGHQEACEFFPLMK